MCVCVYVHLQTWFFSSQHSGTTRSLLSIPSTMSSRCSILSVSCFFSAGNWPITLHIMHAPVSIGIHGTHILRCGCGCVAGSLFRVVLLQLIYINGGNGKRAKMQCSLSLHALFSLSLHSLFSLSLHSLFSLSLSSLFFLFAFCSSLSLSSHFSLLSSLSPSWCSRIRKTRKAHRVLAD